MSQKIPKDKLDLFNKALDSIPEIERKGATVPYSSVNGHMFTQLSKKGSMGLRLEKEVREEFLKKYKVNLYESYGAVMKEYVTIPDELLGNTNALKKYLKLSFEYVKSLKPK